MHSTHNPYYSAYHKESKKFKKISVFFSHNSVTKHDVKIKTNYIFRFSMHFCIMLQTFGASRDMFTEILLSLW